MKTTAKKFICIISTVFILVNMFTLLSFAASPNAVVSIKSDRTSQTAGKTIMLTVHIDVKNGDGLTIKEMNKLRINYNTSLFELVSVAPLVDSTGLSISKANPVVINYKRKGEENFNGDIATITLRIKNTADLGETSFTFSALSFVDKNNKAIQYSCSSPYTDFVISDKASSNNFLSNLVANEGKLSPNFNKNTTKYTMSVSNEVTRVNFQYATEDSAATVKVSGSSNLKLGKNDVKITVTAEDGSTKVYKVTVTREEEGVIVDTSSALPDYEEESMSKETYAKQLQKTKNRYLIIFLVLIFIILAEAAYIIIDKVANKKKAALTSAAVVEPEETQEAETEDDDDDEGEPQSIIDSILNNTDDDLQ